MDRHDVAELGRSLPDCLDKGTDEHPEWYVDDRLVARLDDDTLLVHVTAEDRDHFVAGFPAVFSAPADDDAPPVVRASLAAADQDPRGPDAVRLAFRAAYALRRPPLERP